MKPIDYLYIVILVLCLVLSAVYSAADMTYSSVSKLRLERRSFVGDAKARKALGYARDYDTTIATILFGNDFVNILASSIAVILGSDLLTGDLAPYASLIASLALLFVLLIFGEITPKALAKTHSYGFARHLTKFVKVSQILFFPFVYPANRLAQRIASPLIDRAGPENQVATDDELEAMVNEIESEGIIGRGKSELLQRSIEFKETACYEIMTPRVDVYGYDIETSFEGYLKTPSAFKHSRLIVFQGNIDNVLGYIPVKTLLRILVSGQKPDISSLILPIVSVPRTMMISSAMALMKETHHHIAVVRDEYGGTEGIITLEDILEELVGEMWDEKDRPTLNIRKEKNKNSYLVQGKTNIDDFFDRFGLDPDKLSDDYSTVSGWIVNHLGRFAHEGDHFVHSPLEVTVTKCNKYTVIEARVRYRPLKTKQNKKHGKSNKKVA